MNSDKIEKEFSRLMEKSSIILKNIINDYILIELFILQDRHSIILIDAAEMVNYK